MRQVTVYWLVALNICMLVANVALALYVSSLRNDVASTVKSQNVGCKRANVQRSAVKFLLDGRIHDGLLVSSTAKNAIIADYFKFQARDAQKKLDELLAASKLTVPDERNPYLVDCDKSYPLP